MSRTTRVASALVCLAAVAGCANLAEKRAISRFSTALDEQRLEGLTQGSSPDFSQRALRRDEALDDLKMLRLPTGEFHIVEVEKVSKDERLVTAEVGQAKRRTFYRLVRENGGRKWVVDDVLVRQTREGVRSDRSVSEQMDLLLAVHEFADAWNAGRDEALQSTTPELRQVLADLPPVHFSRLAERVVGEPSEKLRLTSPGVTNEATGIVRVPRKTGTVVLTMRQIGDEWKVADIAVESRADREHIPSVLKTAAALNAGVAFLDAYRAGDKPRLAELCTDSFYRRALLPAELASVPLPPGDVPQHKTRLDLQPTSAEFIVPTGREVVKLSLSRTGDADDSESLPEFRVADVTIYEPGGANGPPQEMRLSVLFTGRAILRLFSEALVAGDLPMLRKTSTADFNRRAWQQLDEETLRDLGPMIALGGGLRVVDTKFHGAVTEITVDEAGSRVTYVLRDRSGDVRVDDVLVSSPGLPPSLKDTVELLLPVRRFATGLSLSRLDLLQRNSSRDLSRHIWTQTDQVPPFGYAAVRHLRAPLTSVEATGKDELLLVLGDERFGARVLLVREHAQHVIDDVMLVAGPEASQQARLKRRLRDELALGRPRQPTVPPAETAMAYGGGPAAERAAAAFPGGAWEREQAWEREPGGGWEREQAWEREHGSVVPAGYEEPSYEAADRYGPHSRRGSGVVPAGAGSPVIHGERRAEPAGARQAAPVPSHAAFDAPLDGTGRPGWMEPPAAHFPESARGTPRGDSGERVHLPPDLYRSPPPRRAAGW